MSERIHFVTGRLAEHSLRSLLAELAPRAGFEYSIDVLGITVAALLTADWIAPRLRVPPGTTRVLLPGYCQGDTTVIEAKAGVPVERGPKDLRRLPEFFARSRPKTTARTTSRSWPRSTTPGGCRSWASWPKPPGCEPPAPT